LWVCLPASERYIYIYIYIHICVYTRTYIYIYIYMCAYMHIVHICIRTCVHTHMYILYTYVYTFSEMSVGTAQGDSPPGKSDSTHHLLEATSGTAAVLELRQKSPIHHPLWVVVVYKIGLPTTACHKEIALAACREQAKAASPSMGGSPRLTIVESN